MIRINRFFKIVTALVLAASIIFVVWHYHIEKNLPILIDIVLNQGVGGYLDYIIIAAIGTAMFFPGSIFVMGAGLIWGITVGSIVASIFLTLSSMIDFHVGRYLIRGWVVKMISRSPKLQRLDNGVANSGFKFVFLIRLSPVFPFTAFNYAFGSTGIKFGNYILATWLGMIPGTIMYVYFGTLILDVTQLVSGSLPFSEGMGFYKLIGLIFSVVATIVIAKIAKNYLTN